VRNPASLVSAGTERSAVEFGQKSLLEKARSCPALVASATGAIADALTRRKHPVSHCKVAQILNHPGYSLQGDRKTKQGEDHPTEVHNSGISVSP
jgi:hypothetical protein